MKYTFYKQLILEILVEVHSINTDYFNDHMLLCPKELK